MKIGIIEFPGSWGELETHYAVKKAGLDPIVIPWQQVDSVREAQGFIVLGGHSFQDIGSPGKIASFSTIISALTDASSSGKPILGIGNGAQILIAAGLLPGLENNKPAIGFKRVANIYNDWVHIKLSSNYQRNAFTRFINEKTIEKVPVATSTGGFIMKKGLLDELKEQGLNVYEYCDPQGLVLNNKKINPLESIHNIAAISNKDGTIMGVIPQIERTELIMLFLQSMQDFIQEQNFKSTLPLFYYPRQSASKIYQKAYATIELKIPLVDERFYTEHIQSILKSYGDEISVQCKVHIEIDEGKCPPILKRKKYQKVLSQSPLHKYFIIPKKDRAVLEFINSTIRTNTPLDAKLALLWELKFKRSPTPEKLLRLQRSSVFKEYDEECLRYIPA